MNIEVNHATLAGHSFHHEVATAIALDVLRQHRREPRRLPERLGHRPVPELGRRARARAARDPRAPAASRPAASTSTRSSGARAWTGPICSTPTSAAWTRWPGRCSSRADMVERGDARRDRARSATRAGADDLGGAILSGGHVAGRRWRTGRSGRDRPAPGIGPPGAAREPRQPGDLGRATGPATAEPWATSSGLDVSTTATKAVLIDEAGGGRRHRRRRVRVRRPAAAVERAGPAPVVGRGGGGDPRRRCRQPGSPARRSWPSG